MASCWPKASATACCPPTTPSSSTRPTNAASTSIFCWATSSSSSMAPGGMTSNSSSPPPPSMPPASPNTSASPANRRPSSKFPAVSIRWKCATAHPKKRPARMRTTKPIFRRPSKRPSTNSGTRSPATCWSSCPANVKSAKPPNTCSVPSPVADHRAAVLRRGRAVAAGPTCCWPVPKSFRSMPACRPPISSASSIRATHHASCWPPTWPKPR